MWRSRIFSDVYHTGDTVPMGTVQGTGFKVQGFYTCNLKLVTCSSTDPRSLEVIFELSLHARVGTTKHENTAS